MRGAKDSRPELRTLLTGLAMGESPRWHAGRLWVSDWGAREIIAVDLVGNSESVTRTPFGLPFCFDWLPDGRLLIVSGRESLLLRRDPDGFAARNIHYHDRSIMSREEAAEYGAIFRDPARTELFIRILRESFDPAARRELETRLSDVRMGKGRLPPVRLLWAREDVLVPPEFGWRYQKLLPSAELVWFDGASQFLQVDDPGGTVREIMRFAV